MTLNTLTLALALFLSAGTLAYWQGWVYLVLYTGGWIVAMLDPLRRDPDVLAPHMGGALAERIAQRLVVGVFTVAFVAIVVVAGLDHRFGWSNVPLAVVVAGDLLVVLGMTIEIFVLRENTYAPTIEFAPGQQVVTTGPYAVVRHPFYAGALIMVFGEVLALGSWWALVPFAVLKVAIVVRLLDEERYLTRSLPDYVAYRNTVRFRLVPGLW
jgi:protein-S-isoprenylcysteine O-methyltransferase Ste14